MSAAVLGAAIAGMHYTAMAGLTVVAHGDRISGAPALSTDLLAIVVAVVAFAVSGIFLLALVPEPVGLQLATAGVAAGGRLPAAPHHGAAAGTASGTDIAEAGGDHAAINGSGSAPRRPALRLPVERDGATHFVAVDDIVAVHANAHYTFIFDGTSKMFCPLAIGDVEARLDGNRFVRVHRSHIVNIDRIVGLKRAGDNGLVELTAPDRYTVPVSRSRLTWLKSQLGLKMGEAVG
jgi:hypothetical protein